jgi:murein DD-endopeptidase MepM/ murein hydrolase activator NlpD
MADIFGGDIDFHRNLRRGDRFSVVYEMAFVNGRPVRAGKILAAEFINEGIAHRAVFFNDGSADGGYFKPDGRSLKTAFLRSPIEFSRISSGFSMRMHPILQTWRAHRGVDYAAPTGTPVRATADGQVEEINRQGGYGNVVVLRHGAQYSTLYAHLDGFAHGMKRGMTVRQGQIIGYVGRTGWATGPHLHYEFRINDVQQDPLKVAMPMGHSLSPSQIATFRQLAAPHMTALDRLRAVNVAQLD